jgi:NTE family protein
VAGPLEPPDVLVLGGGGILGEAWMSALLAGIAEESGFDPRHCDGFVGTSAGSIVAAMLSAGVDPRSGLGRFPEQPPVGAGSGAAARGAGPASRALRLGGRLGGRATSAVAPALLRGSVPGGRLVRRAALGRTPQGQRSLEGLGRMIEEAGADWDGRLRITALELESGRRVVFDGSGEPRLSVAEAVQASCAIPGVFRPLAAGGRRYVDGGAWSLTNMDVADAGRGTRVLCLNPTGAISASRLGALGLVGSASRSAAAIEAAALRSRGARVLTAAPDREAAAAIGGNLMDPSRRPAVVAAGREQGGRLARGEAS